MRRQRVRESCNENRKDACGIIEFRRGNAVPALSGVPIPITFTQDQKGDKGRVCGIIVFKISLQFMARDVRAKGEENRSRPSTLIGDSLVSIRFRKTAQPPHRFRHFNRALYFSRIESAFHLEGIRAAFRWKYAEILAHHKRRRQFGLIDNKIDLLRQVAGRIDNLSSAAPEAMGKIGLNALLDGNLTDDSSKGWMIDSPGFLGRLLGCMSDTLPDQIIVRSFCHREPDATLSDTE